MGEGQPVLPRVDADFYWENGWVLVPDVFTRDEVQSVAALAVAVGEQELRDKPHLPVNVDASADGAPQPRKVDWAYLKHRAFRHFVTDPRLVMIAQQLLGGRAFLLRDQIFLKPSGIGSAKPWHQDDSHLQLSDNDQVVAAWVALDDATESNGCLRYVNGSHRGPILDHHPMPGAEHNALLTEQAVRSVDWSAAVSAEVAAGGVLLHHPGMLHASNPNTSAEPRRAYSSHWALAGVRERAGSDTLQFAYSYTLGAKRYPVYCP
jgi:ectoine hydroxylase-related dioxygenase (phytanoyl-CoA dioxygenase family)